MQVLHVRNHLEILSLSGTISSDGSCHLHISLANEHGEVIGGHLLGEAIVHTTAEVAMAFSNDILLQRSLDIHTGYKELTATSVDLSTVQENL